MITIYKKNGEVRCEVGINEGSIRKYSLMKEDYILLKFSLEYKVPLEIGDYVDLSEYISSYDHEKFRDANDYTTKMFIVDRNYFPTYNSNTGGWDYSVQINAYYYLWGNKVLKYNPEHGDAETAINLTDTIDKHLELITKSLLAAGLKYKANGKEDAEFGVDVDADVAKKGVKFITYDSVSIFDALKLIAETYECEWWVDTSTIHLGYRKITDTDLEYYKGEIPLVMHENIQKASTSKASGTYANRLYAFGGTVNVPTHYRDALDFTVTKAGEDYVYADAKPVKSSFFINTDEAPIETYTISGTEIEYSPYYQYVDRERFLLGSYHFNAQTYRCRLDNFKPYIQFVKVVVRGGINASFSARFTCRLVLESGSKRKEIYRRETVINKKLKQLHEDSSGLEDVGYLDSSTGYIGEGGTFRIDVWGNEAVHLCGDYKKSSFLISTTTGDTRDWLCPFATTDWDKLDRNDTWCNMLVPYNWHYSNSPYTMYVSKIYKNIAIQRGKNQSVDAKGFFRGNEPTKFYLSSYNDWTEAFTIPEEGEYKLYIELAVDEIKEVAWYNDSPALSYDSFMPSFNISFQRTADKKDTHIRYKSDEGEWREANVTVNPNFRDDEHDESSLIQFEDENPLKVGDTFQFPEIIRTLIASKHGEWFTLSSSGNVKGNVVQKNLMLPEGIPYVQADGISDEDAVEGIVTYDWIYPKTDLAVAEVIPFIEKVDGKDVDRWAIRLKYYDKNAQGELTFSQEMFEPNKDLYAIFQDGSNSGIKYAVTWMKGLSRNDKNGKDIEFTSVDFKLEPNTDWGEELPKETFLPKAGDKVILDGLYIEYFDFNGIANAENELLEQAKKDLLIMSKENVVVDFTLNSDDAYSRGRIQLGAETNIKGVLTEEFPSRVIGFEEKLDYPYDSPKYSVSDNNYYSKLGDIDSKITAVQKESFTFSGKGGGNGVTIITNADEHTRPSDRNVFSAYRVQHRFLRKDVDDEAAGNIKFGKNVSIAGEEVVDGKTTLNGGLAVNGYTEMLGHSYVSGDSTVMGSQNVIGSVDVGKNETISGTLRIKKSGEGDTNIAVVIGDYLEQGDTIQGAKITKDGIASFASIKTPSLQVYELVYNRETAVQGEFVLSDGDTVENVTYICADGSQFTNQQIGYGEFTPTYTENEDGTGSWNFLYIRLGLKLPYEGYMTTFKANDILYANVNNIGESGEAASSGKCFMRVLVNEEIEGVDGVAENGTVLNVYLYPHSETPSGINILPATCMVITRHGNETNKDRQDIFLISSDDGRIAQLTGVDSPIVKHDTAYGIVLGRLPHNLIEYVKSAGYSYLNEDHPYLYARGAIVQDLIRIDYKGKVIKTQNYRGIWNADIAASEDNYYDANDISYDTVTHNGSLWQCNKSKTIEEPRGGINDWLLLIAKGDDGTSIKVKGSFDTYDSFIEEWKDEDGVWIAPEDSSDCYIVGQDLYVWLPDTQEWYNAGQFKGDKGDKGDAGQDGKDGKDGVSPMVNLLDNTSFEDLNEDGTLAKWTVNTTYLPSLIDKKESGIGANAVLFEKTNTISGTAIKLKQTVSSPLSMGAIYVLSFYAKSTTGSDVNCRVRPYGGVNLDEVYHNSEVASQATTGINFTAKSEWSRHYFTFRTYENENLDYLTEFRFGMFGTSAVGDSYMLAQIKLEYANDQTDLSKAVPSAWSLSTDDVTGTDGTNGVNGAFKSIVFKRSLLPLTKASTPTGGTYDSPYPTLEDGSIDDSWSDGIPDGEGAVYSSFRMFFGDDSVETHWSEPKLMADNADFEVMYSARAFASIDAAKGSIPTDTFDNSETWWELANTAGWYDDETEVSDPIWMATISRKSGAQWADSKWTVSKIKGEDGDDAGATYTIIPSVDTIYVDNSGYMTVDKVSLKIGETTPHGYNEITSIEELHAKNLYIGVSTDGENYTNHLGPLEDIFSVSPSSREVHFKLVGVRGIQTYAIRTVLVVHQGDDGHSAITFHAEPAIVNVQVDAQDKKLINNTPKTIKVYARDPWGLLGAGEDYKISTPSVTNLTFGPHSISDNKYQFTLEITDGITDAGIPKSFAINFTSKDGKTDLGTLTISIAISERGLAGPQGEAGAMLDPQGNWKADVFYKMKRKSSDNSVLGRPCVYYIEDKKGAKGSYFVLEKDMDESSYKNVVVDGVTVKLPCNPKTDEVITTSDTEYWTPMEYTEYIQTSAIMANWAKFGSDKGAIFYDRFLFSQYGVDKNGKFCHYTEYQDTMFDGESFTDEFVPSMMIDLYAGFVKTNKLAETFQEFRNDDLIANEIDFNQTYNVKYTPNGLCLLSMPLSTNIVDREGNILEESEYETTVDGIRSVILCKSNRTWERRMRATLENWPNLTGAEKFTNVSEAASTALLLCAEPRLFNPLAWKYEMVNGEPTVNNAALSSSNTYETGRFVINGVFSDFLLIEPGMQAILRSCESDGILYWYVENGQDFAELQYSVNLSVNNAYSVENGQVENISGFGIKRDIGYANLGGYYQYYRRTFASSSLVKLYEMFDGNISIDIDTIKGISNVATGDSWEGDIFTIEIKG